MHMTTVSPDQQAMHDALGILGFDLDSDPTPAATIAGMGADGFRGYFLRCMHEARSDHDAAIDPQHATYCHAGICDRGAA